MASCYCYVPLPLTILLQITEALPAAAARALPPNCSTLQQQTSCELPLSVLLKSTAAFASEKREKN